MISISALPHTGKAKMLDSTTVSESHLIQLARRGNSAACSELYDLHYDALYRYCYYHVGNAALAQELTSEVFAQMAENLDKIAEHGRPLLTWLYAIARSVITMSLTEPHLVPLAQQGDSAACSRLYDRYFDAIYRYCYYHVGDPALAQALAGEVFMQMVKQLGQFNKSGQTLLAWLYRLADELVADTYRLDKQRLQSPSNNAWAVSRDTADKNRRRLSAEDLAVALTQLTEEQRQVILLRFVQDYNNVDVARLMDKPEGAIKSQPYHALTALQRILEECPYHG